MYMYRNILCLYWYIYIYQIYVFKLFLLLLFFQFVLFDTLTLNTGASLGAG